MRRLTLISLFAAAMVALGLTFITVPNVELVTLTCFLAGVFLGTRDGIAAAALGEGLYSFLNPMGAAPPPLFLAQVIGMSLAAFVGSMSAKDTFWLFVRFKIDKTKWPIWKSSIFFGVLGLLLTLIFDLLTTASFLLFAGLSVEKFIASLVFGMYFYFLHIGFNTLIFAGVLPVIIPRLETWFLLEQGNRG